MTTLTARQSSVLRWIKRYMATKHIPPTVRDIGRGVGIRSPNGVMIHLRALVKKGAIKRTRRKARSIVLIGEGNVDGDE